MGKVFKQIGDVQVKKANEPTPRTGRASKPAKTDPP